MRLDNWWLHVRTVSDGLNVRGSKFSEYNECVKVLRILSRLEEEAGKGGGYIF